MVVVDAQNKQLRIMSQNIGSLRGFKIKNKWQSRKVENIQ